MTLGSTSLLERVRARVVPLALVASAIVIAGVAGAYIAARLRLERIRRCVSLRSFPSTVARRLLRRPRGAPRGPRRRRAAVAAYIATIAVLALVLLTGCAPAPAGRVRSPSAAALSRLGPIPDTYGAPVASLADPVNARAQEVFERALSPAARASVVHDPALDHVAATFAETVSEESRGIVGPVLTWLTWRSGSTSMFLAAQGRWARGANAAADLDADLTRLARQLGGDGPRAYGVARFSGGSTVWQAVVLGRRPHASVRLLRRRYAPGEPMAVRVEPRPEHRDLVMYMSREGEPVAEYPLIAEPDGTFSAAPPASLRPGRYFVEIAGTSTSGEWRTLLWLPVCVGVAEPAVADEMLRTPPPNPGPLDVWPGWLLGVYNAERAKLGLAPLRLDDKLCALAQQRAGELGRFDAPFVEQIAGPVPGKAASRRRRARRGSFAWSVSFEALSDVVVMQMQRPTARLGLLDPDARWIGIGIAPRRSAEGIAEYEIVEYVR